jgi:hypothetical protein
MSVPEKKAKETIAMPCIDTKEKKPKQETPKTDGIPPAMDNDLTDQNMAGRQIDEQKDLNQTIKDNITPIHTFYGATTLPDRTSEVLPDGTKIAGEILSKKALDWMKEKINNPVLMGDKYGSWRTISLFHDRVYEQNPALEEAGFVVSGTADVVPIAEYPGNYGLSVDTSVNMMYAGSKTYPDMTPEKLDYKIKNKVIGLSLEYNSNPATDKIVEVGGNKYRYVQDITDFRGFGYARANLIGNPTAVAIKEIETAIQGKEAELRRGTQVEAEHKGMIEFIKKYIEDNGKMPSDEEIYAKIAEAHLTEDADYYKKLYEMEHGDKDKVKEMSEEDINTKEKKAVDEDEKKKKKHADEENPDEDKNESSKDEAKEDKDKKANKKVKEMEEQKNDDFVKIKEAITAGFGEMAKSIKVPSANTGVQIDVRIKELKDSMQKGAQTQDWFGFTEKCKELARERGEHFANQLKTSGFDFEANQTVTVRCKGKGFEIVPAVKTKDVLDANTMAESTYYQANAMFADMYVAGITETFLKEDSLLKALNKIEHLGGNEYFQWKLWLDFGTFTTGTASVDPNVTAVDTTKRKFEKMQTLIREYRDGIEVTDFTQFHSAAAVGDLLGEEIMRAADYVTNSLNADLFKEKCDGTTAWLGVNGLAAIADGVGNATLYGKTRSTTNRLLATTASDSYESDSEAISLSVLRKMYEKVLQQGSRLADLAIVLSPNQARRLFDSMDQAAATYGQAAILMKNALTMAPADPSFGFKRDIIPYLDGIPIIRDYRCVDYASSYTATVAFVIDLSADKGFNLVVSKPLGARGLAKVGLSEKAVVNFWGTTVYKSPRNINMHDGLTV